MNLLEKSSTFE